MHSVAAMRWSLVSGKASFTRVRTRPLAGYDTAISLYVLSHGYCDVSRSQNWHFLYFQVPDSELVGSAVENVNMRHLSIRNRNARFGRSFDAIEIPARRTKISSIDRKFRHFYDCEGSAGDKYMWNIDQEQQGVEIRL